MGKPIKRGKTYRVRWIDPTGKRRSQTFKRSKDAEKALRLHQVEADQIRAGIKKQPEEDITFKDFCSFYKENYSKNKRSYKDEKSIIDNRLIPAFGDKKLNEITAEMIAIFQQNLKPIKRKGRLSDKTVRNIMIKLGTILRLAVDMDKIYKLPRFDMPKVEIFSTEFNYLRSIDEIHRLLAAARSMNERFFILITIAIYTGLRAGEIAGLKKSDIDLSRRLITIQRSYDGPTKNGRVRYVPILDPLYPVLREWLLKNSSEYVVPNSIGGMHKPSDRVFQENFHKCLKEAELPRMRFHDLRHTFASMWVKAGGDIFRLQRILGHQSIQMTQRYAHLAPDVYAQDYSRLGTEIPVAGAEVIPIEAKRNK